MILHTQAPSDTLVVRGRQAKTQAECYDYLFDAAIRMRQLGYDASKPPTLKRGAAQINGHDSHVHAAPSENLLSGCRFHENVLRCARGNFAHLTCICRPAAWLVCNGLASFVVPGAQLPLSLPEMPGSKPLSSLQTWTLTTPACLHG